MLFYHKIYNFTIRRFHEKVCVILYKNTRVCFVHNNYYIDFSKMIKYYH